MNDLTDGDLQELAIQLGVALAALYKAHKAMDVIDAKELLPDDQISYDGNGKVAMKHTGEAIAKRRVWSAILRVENSLKDAEREIKVRDYAREQNETQELV